MASRWRGHRLWRREASLTAASTVPNLNEVGSLATNRVSAPFRYTPVSENLKYPYNGE